MSILLINPAAAHGIFGSLGKPLVAVEESPWMRFHVGYLRSNGIQAPAIDAEQEAASADDVAERVEEIDPTFVALICFGHMPSASSQQMFGAREVASAIKRRNPNRIVVIVGGHASALPKRTLLEEPCDYVVKGEGPITLRYLHEALTAGVDVRSMPGLVWRDGGSNVVVNPSAPPLDLDVDLLDQAWDVFDPHKYVAHNWHALGDGANRSPYASIVTTLNCPYACSFCCISAPFGGSGYKMRDPVRVVDEIETLVREYGVRYMKIVDEMFILRPSHYVPICEEIIQRGLGKSLNIWAYGRVDSVRPVHLTLLRRAGFRWIALGIESGSKYVRDGTNKRLRNDDIVGVVRTIQSQDINVIGNYIFGLRDDTMETMRETLDLALECRTEFANFYSCMAYPGSKLYDQAINEGWTLPSSWKGYSQHNAECRPLDTETVPAADVLRFRDAAFTTYFTDPGYLAMIQTKFGPAAVEEIRKMTSYKLRRNLLPETLS